MRFIDFIEKHKELMPKVKHEIDIDNPAVKILSRVWNAFAILVPDMCDDVVRWDMDNPAPHVAPNPYLTKKGKKGKAEAQESKITDAEIVDDVAQDHVEQ